MRRGDEYSRDGRILSLTTYVDGLGEGTFRVWTNDGVLVVARRNSPARNSPVLLQKASIG
jgi:hypothetical protein